MKKGWEVKKLGECFKLKSGEALTSKNMQDGAIPVYGGNGIAGFHNSFNLSGSNVIVGRVGALCGGAKHINEEVWLTDNAFQIVDFKCQFDHGFLTCLLNYKNLRSYARQAAQPVISNSSLKDVILEFPSSVIEQQRIVAILEEAFAVIDQAKENVQRNLQNAKELFQSELNSIFANKGEGWVEMELIEACDQITDGSHFSPASSAEGQYPYITVRDIEDDLINFGNCKFIEESDYNSLLKNGCKPFKGDLLFSKDGTVGKVSLVDFEKDFVVLSSLAIIRPKRNVIDSALLKYILKSPTFLRTAIGKKTGAAIRRIILKHLKQIQISCPSSITEQQKVVKRLESISLETQKLVSIYLYKLESLEELKKAIIQKAFSGELKGTKEFEYALERSI